MTYFADLSRYTFWEYDSVHVEEGTVTFVPRYPRLAVGWLAGGRESNRGTAPVGFVAAATAYDGSWAEPRVGRWFPAGASIGMRNGRMGELTATGVKRVRKGGSRRDL